MNRKKPESIDKLIAMRIRAFRLESGMTQTDLAEKLGVSFQQVQKYEKGVNRIGAGRLCALARVFNVPIQALYPPNSDTSGTTERGDEVAKRVSAFMISADGWRLCHAFLQIPDAALRRKIIALVDELAASAAERR